MSQLLPGLLSIVLTLFSTFLIATCLIFEKYSQHCLYLFNWCLTFCNTPTSLSSLSDVFILRYLCYTVFLVWFTHWLVGSVNSCECCRQINVCATSVHSVQMQPHELWHICRTLWDVSARLLFIVFLCESITVIFGGGLRNCRVEHQ